MAFRMRMPGNYPINVIARKITLKPDKKNIQVLNEDLIHTSFKQPKYVNISGGLQELQSEQGLPGERGEQGRTEEQSAQRHTETQGGRRRRGEKTE